MSKSDVYSVLHVIMVLHIACMCNWDILKSMVIFVALEIKYVLKHAFMGSLDLQNYLSFYKLTYVDWQIDQSSTAHE